MKKYIYLILSILPAMAYSQWQKSDLSPGSMVNCASFLDKNKFIVAYRGKIETTEDGGRTFTTLPNSAFGPIDYLRYQSEDTIYVVARDYKGLYVTYNGGNTWLERMFRLPNGDMAYKTKPIVYMDFFDKNNGIVVGDTLNGLAQVFLTQDGGATWSFYNHPSINQIVEMGVELDMTNFAPIEHCVVPGGVAKVLIGAQHRLLTLSSYGRIWELDTISSRSAHVIAFKDSLNGIAKLTIENVENVLGKTTDGGKTWSIIRDGLSHEHHSVQYVKATPEYDGFYFANTIESGPLNYSSYTSSDEGNTWYLFDTTAHLSGYIFFGNAEVGVYSDVAGTYYYTPMHVGLNDPNPDAVNTIDCYPNPTSGWVQLEGEFQSVSILDLQGKVMINHSSNNQFDTSLWPAGMYWVKVQTKTGATTTQKLMVLHQ